MTVIATIRFGNGSIHRCIGSVSGGKVVPWKTDGEVEQHIARVNERNSDALTLLSTAALKASTNSREMES